MSINRKPHAPATALLHGFGLEARAGFSRGVGNVGRRDSAWSWRRRIALIAGASSALWTGIGAALIAIL